MQKILAYLVLLLLPLAARGQALSDWYYWFDTDKVPQASGQVSEQQFHLEADVSNLSIGAHTLFVQVADTAGVYSTPLGIWFYHVPDSKNIDKLFYQVGEENTMHSVDFGDGKLELDVSGISTGLHALNLQVMDINGSVSAINTYLFYKVPASSKIEKLRYWIDGSENIKEEAYGQNNFLIDVSECIPGFHFIYYYVVDAAGVPSTVQSAGFYRMPMESKQKLYYWFAGDTQATEVKDFANGFVADVTHVQEGFNTIYTQIIDHGPTDIETHHFIKVAQTEGSGDLTVACIIDGMLAAEQKVPCHGGVINLDMDVSNIAVGMHKAMFQVITPTGAGSSIAETYFIRTLTNDDVASMQCSYTIDGFKHYTQKGTLTNGTFHFDLPVDEVEDGLHRIDFMLVAENGATTTQGNAWFFKTPLGGNAITQYDYWLNDKVDEISTVTLKEYQDPFKLLSLLPVPSEPIRSSCYHFEVKDGKPMMYAKNDIHFRFHDKTGRWVDESKQYVDYNTSAAITDVTELQSTQTFARPEENDIKWFRFDAAPGDTIGFKASQATSLQVFAPSGQEIYAASGDKSVVYGGAHTWEDGTYYVAVHDITGTKPNVTLDYMHMDKYDVVSQDVRVVGNGGCSTITFQGNGFRDLYAVDLYTALGDTIHSIDVGHESDAETTVTFDFTGAELGIYNALFRFAEGEKTSAKNITVEEAKDIELVTSVTYPTSFLRGTSTTYTVKITNKGNMTAYYVPVECKMLGVSKSGIDKITIEADVENSMIPELLEELAADGILEELDDLRDLLKEIPDFVFVKDSINNLDYGLAQLFIRINPNSSKEIKISIKSNQTISLYAYVPQEWHPTSYDVVTETGKLRVRKASAKEWLCCYRERIECVTDAVSLITPPGYGCAANLANTGFKAVYDIGCTEGNGLGNKAENYFKNNGRSLAADIAMSAVSCITKYFGNRIKSLRYEGSIAASIGNTLEVERIAGQIELMRRLSSQAIQNVLAGIGSAIVTPKCYSAFRDPKPGCPPNPGGGGGPSTPVNSLDPNDIFGYTAESGSKFVADSIVGLNYRIEFENDTTFATASAHVVEIRDTLDSRVLDLATFAPTSIKIGEKTESLDGTPNFLKTIDMRPEINAIAQVEGKFDVQKGIATWTFTSLDPMTMEPTDDVMQGFLPVNYDGVSGIGEVSFDINRKAGLADGTEIPNRASIIFDYNDVIMTPVWTNIIDAVAPESSVIDVTQQGDSAIITCEGTDERSGIWKYEVYAQPGTHAPWIKVGECFADSATISYEVFADIDYGFCALAVDSAGNVEKKELEREFSLNPILYGDVNGDGSITISDAVGIVNFVIHANTSSLNEAAADANEDGEVTITDAVFVVNRVIHSNQKNKNLYEKETNYRVTGTRRHANAQ